MIFVALLTAFSVTAVSASAETAVCVQLQQVVGLYMKRVRGQCEERLVNGTPPEELRDGEFEIVQQQQRRRGRWRRNGTELTTESTVEVPVELALEDTKVPIIGKARVLCSGVLDGWDGPNSLGWISEVLSLSGVKVNTTPLAASGLSCTAQTGCESSTSPTVWAVNLGWETEVVLYEAFTTTGFWMVILPHSGGGNPGWELTNCLVLGVANEDECTGTEIITELTLEGTTSLVHFPGAGLEAIIGNCTSGGSEAGVVEGEGSISFTSGGELTASFETSVD